MKSKLVKKLTCILMKSIPVLSMLNFLVFTGCQKDDPPKEKSLEQSVVLNNDVEINYSASLSNVDGAKLNVKKDGVLISSEEISDYNTIGPDYKKTYSYTIDNQITKGSYEFTLTPSNTSDIGLQKKNNVTIANYTPTVNNPDMDLNDESKKMVPLEPKDKNPEDNPVRVNYVTSVDGKTQATLNKTQSGYDLSITALPDKTGPYQLEIEFGSASGGLEKKIFNGEILQKELPKLNYTVPPNDSTKNFYGSGDANNNNILDMGDVTRANDVIAGYFSDPNDRRLRDRIDVNGDGNLKSEDANIIGERLSGVRAYLPGEWKKLTKEQKIDWVKKMFIIDKTSEINFPGGDCNQFADQTYINFHGASLTDIPKFREVYNYDFKDNGRFNLPLLEVVLIEYTPEGVLRYGHAMNAFIFGDPKIFENTYKIEPQNDHMDVQFGEEALIGENSKFYIRGSPIVGSVTSQTGDKDISMTWYVTYNIKNKIPTLTFINPRLANQKKNY